MRDLLLPDTVWASALLAVAVVTVAAFVMAEVAARLARAALTAILPRESEAAFSSQLVRRPIRIVRLAEPFPALPESKEQVDELYISRTWQFLPGDILRNR